MKIALLILVLLSGCTPFFSREDFAVAKYSHGSSQCIKVADHHEGGHLDGWYCLKYAGNGEHPD